MPAFAVYKEQRVFDKEGEFIALDAKHKRVTDALYDNYNNKRKKLKERLGIQ